MPLLATYNAEKIADKIGNTEYVVHPTSYYSLVGRSLDMNLMSPVPRAFTVRLYVYYLVPLTLVQLTLCIDGVRTVPLLGHVMACSIVNDPFISTVSASSTCLLRTYLTSFWFTVFIGFLFFLFLFLSQLYACCVSAKMVSRKVVFDNPFGSDRPFCICSRLACLRVRLNNYQCKFVSSFG